MRFVSLGMSLETIGESILKDHNDLFFELIQIPEKRTIECIFDDLDDRQIAKTHFVPPLYNWPIELINRLRNHLKKVFEFLDSYYFWVDEVMKALISITEPQYNNQSIIFLLEQDMVNIDDIYDTYLVEKTLSKYKISYFKQDEKKKWFEPKIISHSDLEKWISNDAKKQIIDRFAFLWNDLQLVIESCIEEGLSSIPKKLFTIEYIKEQNTNITFIIENYTNLALLNLSKISELFLLQLLNLNRKPKQVNLAVKAMNQDLITKNQMQNFESIRKESNMLKHTLNYEASADRVFQLWKNFSNLINQN